MSARSAAWGFRRRAGLLSLLLVLAAVLFSLVPWRLGLTQARARHEIYYAAPANGDHMYYTSMMLQFAGVPFTKSAVVAARYFGYPGDWRALQYLSPDFAPLIYPRTALPLMGAPFVGALGVRAIYVPGILCGLTTLFLLFVAARRWRAEWVLAPPMVMFCLTPGFQMFGTGLFTEAVLMTTVAGMLVCLPLAGHRAGPASLAWLAALTVVAALSRQAALVSTAMAFAGFTGAALLRRGNLHTVWQTWRSSLFVSGLFGVGATLIIGWWAPFDILASTSSSFHQPNRLLAVFSGLGHVPREFVSALNVSFAHYPLEVVFLVLGLVSVILLLGDPLGWSLLGSTVVPFLTAGLNPHETLRYLSPFDPVLVLAIAVVTHGFLSRRSAAYAEFVRQTPRRRNVSRAKSALAAASAVVVAVSLVTATLLVYQPAPRLSGGVVSAADLPGAWPLTVPSVGASCGGDDGQAWLTVGGRTYALSGTALARRGLDPSARALRLPSSLSWTIQSRALLLDVLERCLVVPPQVGYWRGPH